MDEKTAFKLSYLFVVVLLFFVLACGQTIEPDWTIRGDDMAVEMGKPNALGGTVENDATPGAKVSFLYSQIKGDDDYYKRIIIFAGYNSLADETLTVEEIIVDYIKLIISIGSEKTYCISIPNFTKDERIADFNKGIAPVCGEDGFIDTDALIFDEEGNLLPGMTNDDIYPTKYLIDLIVQAILEKEEP